MEASNINTVTDNNYPLSETIHKRNARLSTKTAEVCGKCGKEINPGELIIQSYRRGQGFRLIVINCCEKCGLSKDDSRLVFTHCDFCGRAIYKISKGCFNKHTFCSDKCQYSFYNHKNGEVKRTGREYTTCIICGAIFTAQRSNTKFCSNACKQKHYRRGKEERGIGQGGSALSYQYDSTDSISFKQSMN
jgi:predicted nucleic acid-binding Zn ribbon protein